MMKANLCININNCVIWSSMSGFDNSEFTKKKTQWRIDYSHKKKFDTDLSFNPVVYGMD